MVDSNDWGRVLDALEELRRLLREPRVESMKVLVFANKQDLPDAITAAELTDKLDWLAMALHDAEVRISAQLSGLHSSRAVCSHITRMQPSLWYSGAINLVTTPHFLQPYLF